MQLLPAPILHPPHGRDHAHRDRLEHGEARRAGGLLGILLISGAGAPAPGEVSEGRSAPPAWPWTRSKRPPAPVHAHTLLDSVRAETALPAEAVRRPIDISGPVQRRPAAGAAHKRRRPPRVAPAAGCQPSLIVAVLLTENTTLRPQRRRLPLGPGPDAGDASTPGPASATPTTCGRGQQRVPRDARSRRNLRVTSTSTAALYGRRLCGGATRDCHRYPGRVLARASRVRGRVRSSPPPTAGP